MEYYYEGNDKAFESYCYEIKGEPIRWMYGCLSKSLTSLRAKPGRHTSARGSRLVLVNDDSTVMLHWSVWWVLLEVEVSRILTMHHTAAQWRTLGRTKVRP